MDKVLEGITGQLESHLEERPDLFLVDIIKKGNDRSAKILVLVDGDEGLSIDECAEISRKLSRYIDENLELANPLTLEVSSPGLDHPISSLRQYMKNIGKNIRVLKQDGSQLEGKLTEASEEKILIEKTLDKKKKLTDLKEIYMEDINKTIVLISFK